MAIEVRIAISALLSSWSLILRVSMNSQSRIVSSFWIVGISRMMRLPLLCVFDGLTSTTLNRDVIGIVRIDVMM